MKAFFALKISSKKRTTSYSTNPYAKIQFFFERTKNFFQ